ncbi:TRADD-N-associated membrane domain-containing protein [Microcoleus sp. B13-B6]|uniref:TRADD-N-associated membrane domain-containing protein n=1 Tax=Microcoleus sp. B13-B6 TaxID=2818652 RepID=UPI00403F4D5A
MITSALVNILGIGLLFSGKVTEGSVATAGGLTSNIVSVGLLKFTKETNDRLDRLAKEFKDDN